MFKEEEKVRFLGFSKDENGNDFSEPEWNKFVRKIGIISWVDDGTYKSEYPINLSFYDEGGNFLDGFGVKESEIELVEEV